MNETSIDSHKYTSEQYEYKNIQYIFSLILSAFPQAFNMSGITNNQIYKPIKSVNYNDSIIFMKIDMDISYNNFKLSGIYNTFTENNDSCTLIIYKDYLITCAFSELSVPNIVSNSIHIKYNHILTVEKDSILMLVSFNKKLSSGVDFKHMDNQASLLHLIDIFNQMDNNYPEGIYFENVEKEFNIDK